MGKWKELDKYQDELGEERGFEEWKENRIRKAERRDGRFKAFLKGLGGLVGLARFFK